MRAAHHLRPGLAGVPPPASERDVNALMALYKKGVADGGFDEGIRMALEGILASPRFVFRFEERPATARAGQAYAVSDVDLASRLSFFLWPRRRMRNCCGWPKRAGCRGRPNSRSR